MGGGPFLDGAVTGASGDTSRKAVWYPDSRATSAVVERGGLSIADPHFPVDDVTAYSSRSTSFCYH